MVIKHQMVMTLDTVTLMSHGANSWMRTLSPSLLLCLKVNPSLWCKANALHGHVGGKCVFSLYIRKTILKSVMAMFSVCHGNFKDDQRP